MADKIFWFISFTYFESKFYFNLNLPNKCKSLQNKYRHNKDHKKTLALITKLLYTFAMKDNWARTNAMVWYYHLLNPFNLIKKSPKTSIKSSVTTIAVTSVYELALF